MPAFIRRISESFRLHTLLIKHQVNSFHVAFQPSSVSISSLSGHLSVMMITWSPSWETKEKHWEKWSKEPNTNTMFSPKNDMIIQEKLTCESADADVIFVASWLSNSHVFNSSHSWQCWFLTNITWNGPSRKSGAKETSRVSRKKTSFSLVEKCAAPGGKEGLMLHECSEIGVNVNIYLPLFTAVIKLSAFTDAFVKQSVQQFWVGMCARSWIFPEQASFRIMDIMLICLLFVQVSELFLLLFPGSLLQFSHMNIRNLTRYVHP